MIKDYTILVPDMLPMQFSLIISVMKTYGYNMELIKTKSETVAQTGLKYTHNDTCYPAILVVGQFMEALLSGKYDKHKTALVMFQTGGGCRASNYVSLIRKALKKADMEYVPVISFNIVGVEKHPGFKIGVKKLHSMMYAVLYGDLLMSLVNQVKPYEINSGEADELAKVWTERLGKELGAGGVISYRNIKKNYKRIVEDFANIKRKNEKKVKVGIVGEIFVKYSPLANNELEQFLINEGAEVVVPGLYDFCLYCAYNWLMDYRIYRRNALRHPFVLWCYKFLCRKKNDIINIVKQDGTFEAWSDFDETSHGAEDLISSAVKMGEGWLLTAEMMELAKADCKNIVCTQPFGCLPNHICGKGMMKPIKEKVPDINIVAVDFDSGASRVNQENRLKLMLSNASVN